MIFKSFIHEGPISYHEKISKKVSLICANNKSSLIQVYLVDVLREVLIFSLATELHVFTRRL